MVMTKEELNIIIENHQHWLNRDCEGWERMRANLGGVNLMNAKLINVDLRYANLENANLTCANLNHANLSKANLTNVDLRGASLIETNLVEANLEKAELGCACLTGADLREANLAYANLQYANLARAYLLGTNLKDTVVDLANFSGTTGINKDRKGKILTTDLIGYKKCENNVIVKLLIPRGAIVFSINGKKCRTNKVKVLEIEGADRAFSWYNGMSYYVGDEITVYDFNCQYNIICAKGIHFFKSREEAEAF